MPGTGVELFKMIEASAKDASAPAGLVRAVVTSMLHFGYTTVSLVEGAVEGGALLKIPPDSGAVTRLGDKLLTAPASAITDGVAYRTTLVQLALSISKSYHEGAALVAAPPTTPAGNAPDEDEKSAMSAYNDLRRLQNSAVELSRRCVFVGEARGSVLKHGHIGKVPELLTVRLFGTAGQGKRKLGGLEGATLELDEAKPKSVDSIQAAHRLTRDVILGVVAALSKSIKADLVSAWVRKQPIP